MKKRMCPICDLPVNDMNYCPGCRRIIRRPVLREVNYYLNENRPRNARVPEIRRPSAAAAKPREEAAKPKEILKPKDEKPSRIGRDILIAMGILVGGIFLSAAIAIMKLSVEELNADSGDFYTESEYEEEDYGLTEMDEETVRKIGEPCSGYGHFQADGRTVTEELKQFIEESGFGYTIDSLDTYSSNYEMEDQEGIISWYETLDSFTLSDENTAGLSESDDGYVYQYVDVNWDTATGEIHEYQSALCSKEASLAFLERFLSLVEEAEASDGESLVPGIMEQAAKGIEKENGIRIAVGAFDISIYPTENGVGVYVSYYEPGEEKEQEI